MKSEMKRWKDKGWDEEWDRKIAQNVLKHIFVLEFLKSDEIFWNFLEKKL